MNAPDALPELSERTTAERPALSERLFHDANAIWMREMRQSSRLGRTPWILFALTLLLRSFYVFRHGFDSDEWQHLHVVWAATRGLTQYRDVFDNHAPLFHETNLPAAVRGNSGSTRMKPGTRASGRRRRNCTRSASTSRSGSPTT